MNGPEKISGHEAAGEGGQPSEWDSLKDLEFDAGRAEAAREESRKVATTEGSEIPQGSEAEKIAADLKSEILEEGPMTPEEKERLLDFDALAELSTEEYLQLWRRLNPYYVSHVTRQGIRDHADMRSSHNAGMGSMISGLKDILGDGKVLKSSAAIHGLDQEVTEKGVRDYLEAVCFGDSDFVVPESRAVEGYGDAKTITGIINSLPVNDGIAAADHWGDRRAIHVAKNEVAEGNYGGERGNEVFFVFPSDVIVSQTLYGGHTGGGFISKDNGGQWNDVFIWPKNGDLPIDAGITFLPKSTKVAPETGSKYELAIDEDGNMAPQRDPAIADKFIEFAKNMPNLDDMDWEEKRQFLKESLDNLGVPEGARFSMESCLEAISNRSFAGLYPEEREGKTAEELLETLMQKVVSEENLDLKLAENPITAEEYWENYFRDHPDERPAHVIYYDGAPTKAVERILGQIGVSEGENYTDYGKVVSGPGETVERDGKYLGFDKHYADDRDDPRVQEGHERFNQLARKVIAERFGLIDKHGRIDGVDEGW